MTTPTLKIKNSLNWPEVKTRLWNIIFDKVNDTGNCRQLRLMLHNIDSTVAELSKAEVEDRRGRSSNREALLEQINTDIQLIEEFILMAALIG